MHNQWNENSLNEIEPWLITALVIYKECATNEMWIHWMKIQGMYQWNMNTLNDIEPRLISVSLINSRNMLPMKCEYIEWNWTLIKTCFID